MFFRVKILDHVPIASDRDIDRGYFARYFVSKANQTTTRVHEVSRNEYDRLKRKDFITNGRLNWTIRGSLEDTILNLYTGNPAFEMGKEPIAIPGVLTQNQGAVIFLSRRIPALQSYLRRFDQFYVGE